MKRFHLSWFRLGLIGITLFVFTQKQVDFTVSVGKEGLAIGANEGRHMANNDGEAAGAGSVRSAMLSLLPFVGSASPQVTATKPWNVNDLNESAVQAYVSRFEKVARGEERKYSIPAAAGMALAILHSNAGKSTAATKKNNHFFPVTANTHYENAWLNWRAHSELITDKYPRLASESVNYQQWVAALAKTDYSQDKQLVSKVMDIVERYQLERL